MSEIQNYPTHSDELKPCPFCGENPMWYYSGTSKGGSIITVECLHCRIKMQVGVLRYPLEWGVNVIKTKWNNRANNERNTTKTD